MTVERRANSGARAAATLVAVLAAGATACGGLTSVDLYRPVGPMPAPGQPRMGESGDFGWTLDGDGFRLFLPTVELSEKLTWVFGPLIAFPTFWEDPVPREGPLRIGLSLTCLEGSSVSFDPDGVTIEFEDGRSLEPVAIGSDRDADPEPVPAEPIALTGRESWHGFLEFDAALADLDPFTLTLPTLTVDGADLNLPPIPFERGKTRGSS